MEVTQTIIENFTEAVKKSFQTFMDSNPEDQLKRPVSDLIENIGNINSLNITTNTEVKKDEIGRPDIGVASGKLLIGYVELKAPGKGANPNRYTGRDKAQWQRFQNLPNIIYTDGNEWTLFQNGKKIGTTVIFNGDVTSDGKKSVTNQVIDNITNLFRSFLYWEPISPKKPKELAELLAPICHFLRSTVIDELSKSDSAINHLLTDVRKYLFPTADDYSLADAYAQTITYTLLLAQLTGDQIKDIDEAVSDLRNYHYLLSEILGIFNNDRVRREIEVPIMLLERIISAVDPAALSQKEDPWLYFYEDFLSAYDPKLRKDRGVYYTPIEVVNVQVRLVAELLETYFNAKYSFAEENVITLDPATGTGTYLLAALDYALNKIEEERGPGMRKNAAYQAAKNMHGFEFMVGPYTVAHLRLTQAFRREGAQLPEDGLQIYLTDTLESPDAPPLSNVPFIYEGLKNEHMRAQRVKKNSPVLVCIGNPPYDRQQGDASNKSILRKGGWVRFGEKGGKPIFDDFTEPLTKIGAGLHAKNLYNDYVYFWRWALWKVVDEGSQGIVSFITASSFLNGPGFSAMREYMRKAFDEIWIIDLEGDSHGARKSENIFQIQSPVAITIGVRYKKEKTNSLANTYYTRISGNKNEKLSLLNSIKKFDNIPWKKCLHNNYDPFLPTKKTDYWKYPLLTYLYPIQENGIQFKRTWPIGVSKENLEIRWKEFVNSPIDKRSVLLRETDARKITKIVSDIDKTKLPSLSKLSGNEKAYRLQKYSYRSFDRQWAIVDPRLIDRPRPELQRMHNEKQLYLVSLLTKTLGEGPSAIVTNLLPDLDYFCNRGARDVIPLYSDDKAKEPNISEKTLQIINTQYSSDITAEDFFAYTYAILFSPKYIKSFWEELSIPGIRLPITKNKNLFTQSVNIGKQLIFLHTFGERFIQKKSSNKIPIGISKCKTGVPGIATEYPEKFSYNEKMNELFVGKGVFSNVRPEVWNFTISGFQVVKSWLGYRMKKPSGKKSSPLDYITPDKWTFDNELLDLLWVLDNTIDLLPEINNNLDEILKSELFTADDFPKPSPEETKSKSSLSLFDFAGINDFDE